MKIRSWRRWVVVATAVVVLPLTMAAACPSASQTGCKNTNAGAAYTIEIKNDDKSTSMTVQLIVGEPSKLADWRRHGEEVIVPAGGTVTKTVTVTKAQGKRDVKVFWPAPHGNDTFLYNKVLDSTCP